GPMVNGTLDGDLVLKGYGDPKITVEQWQAFMTSLRAAGLSTVTGDLVLDRSLFEPDPVTGAVDVRAEPPLPQVTIGPPPRPSDSVCNDWRAAIGAAFVD